MLFVFFLVLAHFKCLGSGSGIADGASAPGHGLLLFREKGVNLCFYLEEEEKEVCTSPLLDLRAKQMGD